EAGELAGEVDEVAPASGVRAVGVLGVAGDLLGELGGAVEGVGALGEAVQLGGGQAEGLADVADGAALAVGGEDGDEGGVLAAPLLVDLLDEARADVARE